MAGNNGLPSGWEEVKFKDVIDTVRGISFPKDAKTKEYQDGYIACLRTANVQTEVEWGDLWFVPREFVKRDEQIVRASDILMSTANSLKLVGKVALVRELPYQATLGAFITLLRIPREQNAKYIYYLLSSDEVQSEIRSRASTTTNISNVSTTSLQDIKLKIAPRSEQDRIVSKLEETFTQLEAGIAELQNAKAQLKRYRAAVLKSAVEGELTREWRESHQGEIEPAEKLLARIQSERREKWEAEGGKGKYKDPAAPNTDDLPELPEGWAWTAPDQLASTEKYALAIGPFGSNLKVSDYTDDGVPLVFVRNIRSEIFDNSSTKFVSIEKAEELKAHKAIGGDILITKMGEPPGDACLYPETRPQAIITADCVKWTLSPFLEAKRFFVHAVNSHLVKSQIINITKGVAQKKISLARFKTVAIPLPPLEEQEIIAAKVERRLSVADEIEKELDESLVRAKRLRGSVLKSAFEGRLV